MTPFWVLKYLILSYMHKYVEAVKLLIEFELLYNIEFLKKDGINLFFIVELLPEFEFNCRTRNKQDSTPI
jgi:hypothetical protein